MTRKELRDALEAGHHLACRWCGLLSDRGCRHTTEGFDETDVLSVAPAYLFSPLAPRAPEPLLMLRISSDTGLPLPQRTPLFA